jgi:hypothetical protein
MKPLESLAFHLYFGFGKTSLTDLLAMDDFLALLLRTNGNYKLFHQLLHWQEIFKRDASALPASPFHLMRLRWGR